MVQIKQKGVYGVETPLPRSFLGGKPSPQFGCRSCVTWSETFVCTRVGSVEWYCRIWIYVTADRFHGHVGAVTIFDLRFWFRSVEVGPTLGRYLGRSYLGRTKSKPKAKNRHGPHTAQKSEISGHIYSNSTLFLNSCTTCNNCFTFPELNQRYEIIGFISFSWTEYLHFTTRELQSLATRVQLTCSNISHHLIHFKWRFNRLGL